MSTIFILKYIEFVPFNDSRIRTQMKFQWSKVAVIVLMPDVFNSASSKNDLSQLPLGPPAAVKSVQEIFS